MGGDKKTTSVEAGIKHKPRTEESLLAWNPTPHTCIAADSFKDATKKPLHPDFPVKCTFKANKKKNQGQKSNKRPKTLHHHQTSFSHYLQEMQHCNAWTNSTYKWASVALLGREGTLPCSYLWTLLPNQQLYFFCPHLAQKLFLKPHYFALAQTRSQDLSLLCSFQPVIFSPICRTPSQALDSGKKIVYTFKPF